MLYHILLNGDTNLLKIDNIGFSDDPKICRFGPGQRELYLIHYVISGEGMFNGNPVKNGQGFLITPNSRECYYPTTERWKILWVTSRDPNMKEIFESYNAHPNTRIFSYGYVKEADELTVMLKNNHGRCYTASKILEIFLNLYNNGIKETAVYRDTAEIYCKQAVNYIQSNLFRRIRVGELTAFLRISQPSLYNAFMQKLSVSPKEYIDGAKLSEAKKLLLKTDMPVSEVARSVGFEDQFAFSKFFRKKTGIPPTVFRKL